MTGLGWGVGSKWQWQALAQKWGRCPGAAPALPPGGGRSGSRGPVGVGSVESESESQHCRFSPAAPSGGWTLSLAPVWAPEGSCASAQQVAPLSLPPYSLGCSLFPADAPHLQRRGLQECFPLPRPKGPLETPALMGQLPGRQEAEGGDKNMPGLSEESSLLRLCRASNTVDPSCVCPAPHFYITVVRRSSSVSLGQAGLLRVHWFERQFPG